MTTSMQIIFWRDIPAQVKARSGRTRLAKPLSDRFQQAIDEAAMRAGMSGTDEYLQEWRTVDAPDQDGEPEAIIDRLVARLEMEYPPEKLKDLASGGGRQE
jgi:Virulence factor